MIYLVVDKKDNELLFDMCPVYDKLIEMWYNICTMRDWSNRSRHIPFKDIIWVRVPYLLPKWLCSSMVERATYNSLMNVQLIP